jgi:hypothetical protein
MKVELNTQRFTNPAFRASNDISSSAVANNPTSSGQSSSLLENFNQQLTSDVGTNNVSQPTLKSGIANVWKFITVANKMANASLKGLFYGALTGVTLLSGSWLFKSLPKAFTKEGPTLANTILHPLKNISKSGKIIAGIGSGVVLAYHLIAGKLDANQSTAVIDHKLKIGHRDK